jgi:Spy/CpxP family protein refolding chaperone
MKVLQNMMRTAALVLCGAALTMVPARAQESAPPPPPPPAGAHAGGGMMAMMKELNLTPDQVQQIKAIRAEQPQVDPSDRKAMGQARKAQMQKIRAVLTPEQQKKFDDAMAQQRANRAGGPGGEAPPPPPPAAPPQN